MAGAAVSRDSEAQIPVAASLRQRHDLHDGNEVDVVEDAITPRIGPVGNSPTPGSGWGNDARPSEYRDKTPDVLTPDRCT
jgi:hypothetical protein